MIKIFCDSCGDDTEHHYKTLSVPIHIVTPEKSGYVTITSKGSFPDSGVVDNFHLCLSCSNRVYKSAFESLKGGKDDH